MRSRKIRRDHPEAVVFAERDGLFWLGGDDLGRFELAMGIDYGCNLVGFDRCEAMTQALSLMRRGVRVGLRRGETVTFLREPARSPDAIPETKSVFLAPELLLDRPELDRLAQSLRIKRCHIGPCFERWRSMLTAGELDMPAVYVLRMTETMYEVDWQFTELSEESFQGLALAADILGLRLACRLVSAKRFRRTRRSADPIKQEVYGQLRLTL